MIFSHRTALQRIFKVGLSEEVFLSPLGAMRGASLEKMLEKVCQAKEKKCEGLGRSEGPTGWHWRGGQTGSRSELALWHAALGRGLSPGWGSGAHFSRKGKAERVQHRGRLRERCLQRTSTRWLREKPSAQLSPPSADVFPVLR